jgi:hypothetical protein
MSPRRSPKSGLRFNNWVIREGVGLLTKYKKGVNLAGPGPYSPVTTARLVLRRQAARRAVHRKQKSNAAALSRNTERISRMLKEIENYKARKPVFLVRQPSGGLAMAKPIRRRSPRN